MGQKRQTTLRRRHQEAEKSGTPDPKDVLLRIARAGGAVTEADRQQLFRVNTPRCTSCRVNNRESPNCLCGLAPPRGSYRKTGLWRKLSDALADLGDDPGQRLRPSPSLATASSSSQAQAESSSATGSVQQQSRDSKSSKAGGIQARGEEVPSPGLTNLGATCYVNSVLQCLFRTPGFLSGLFACSPQAFQTHPVLRELGIILAQLHSGRLSVVDTGQLAEALRLDSALQQDGQEFMKLLLELTENLLGPEGSFISRLFSGSLSYVTKCSVCKQASESSSNLVAFVELELNVQRMGSLEESIGNYFQPEELCGENQYLCARCSRKTDAERAVVLKRLPQILMFQLKRFVFDPKTYTRKKVTSPMTFPLELDLQSLGCADSLQPLGSEAQGPGEQYALTGVLLHKGSAASSGHYVAHVRDTSSPLGQWWKCDDEEVTPCGDWPFPAAEREKEMEKEGKEKKREKQKGNEQEKEVEEAAAEEENGKEGGREKGMGRGRERSTERDRERDKGRGAVVATDRAGASVECEEAESDIEEIDMAQENGGDASDREQQGHGQGHVVWQGKGKGKGRQKQKVVSINGVQQSVNGPKSSAQKGHGKAKPTPSATPCKSSEAYMLVYTSRAVLTRAWARQEPAPSPPEFLAQAVQALEAQVEREGEGFERMRKEMEERALRRQVEVRAVLQEMPVPHDEQAYQWIATEWLKNWADSPSDPPPVDNSSLLCESHGKVSHHNVSKMKRISPMAWAQLVSQFNGGPSLSEADCCDECIREESQTLACASSFQDKRNQTRELVEANLQGRLLGTPRDCFYVSKPWLLQWLRRTKVNAPQPSDADPLGAIVCPHGRLAPEEVSGARRALVSSAAWAYFARVAKEASERESEGEGEGEGDEGGEREGGATEGRLEKGKRKGKERRGDAEGQKGEEDKGEGEKRDRGRGTDGRRREGKEGCVLAGVPGTAETCPVCREERQQGAEEEAQLRESKLGQQKEFQELYSTRPFPLQPGVCYCILPLDWVTSWRSYLAAVDAKSLSRGQAPGSLQECRDVCICSHGKLIQPVTVVQKKQGILLDPQDFWVAMSEETWQRLCQQWGCRQEDGVMLQVNQVDGATGIPEDHNQGLNESHRGTAAGPESLGTKGDKAGSGLHKAGQGEGKAGAGGYKAGEGGDKGGEYEVGRGGGGVSGGEGDSEAEEGKGSGVKQSTDLIVQTVPEVCPTCASSSTNGRVISEYKNEKISVQLAPGSTPPASLTRTHVEKPAHASRRSKRARRGLNVAPLTVSSDTTVWKLKLLVWEALEVVPENQRLGFESRELTDGGITLKEAGIFPGAALWLVDTKVHEDRDIAECVTSDVEGGQEEVGFRGSLLLQGSHARAGVEPKVAGGEGDKDAGGVPKSGAAAGEGHEKETEREAKEGGVRGGEEGNTGAGTGGGAKESHADVGYKEEPEGFVDGADAGARAEREPLRKEANKVHLQRVGARAVGVGAKGERMHEEDPMDWTPPSGDEGNESGLED